MRSIFESCKAIPLDEKPISIEEIKNYLRISHDYDDKWISDLIGGSIIAAENFLRLKVVKTRVEIICKYMHTIYLPYLPIIDVESIFLKEKDSEIKEYKVSGDKIEIDKIYYGKLKVSYLAGYSNIPTPIKQGIMLHIAESYDSRGMNSLISKDVRGLYQPYRRLII